MHMHKLMASAILALFATPAAFADEATLSDIVVSSHKETPMTQPDAEPWAHDQVTREGIAVLGGPAQTSTFRLFNLMPSVNAESADAYGTSANRNLNVRGRNSGLAPTVEGVPLTMPTSPGGADLFDLENAASFDFYRSAMPAGKGFGVWNIQGAADMTLRRPEEKFGAELSQGFGSFNFSRTFIRLDSGRVGPGNTSFFISASDMQANKWKGAGEAERRNITFGLVQPFSNGARAELFVLSNHIAANDYRPMNYAQMQDKSNWRKFDYDATPNPTQRQLYYGVNRQEFNDTAVMANLILPVGENGRFTFRTHFLNDEGYTLSSSSTNVARWWDIQHQQVGFVAQYDLKISPAFDLTAGYWWMKFESPPPPLSWKDLDVAADGGVSFRKWSLLSRQGDHEYRSPFIQLTGRSGAATVSGGLRLVKQHVPFFSYYNTTGLPDGSYDQVWSSNPSQDPWMQVKAKEFQDLLPNLSLRYDLRPDVALTGAYSRLKGSMGWGPTVNTYLANRAAYVAKGINLQQVLDGLNPEASENIDLGLRYEGERLSLAPNFYYSRSRDVQVSLYDPVVGVSNNQGNARTIGKGVELEGSYRLNGGLSTIFSVSYNHFVFDGDLAARNGALAPTDGKQFPNAARIMARLGLDWRSGNWNISPVMRYTGKRYGDIFQKQEVSAYWLADLHAAYQWKNVGTFQELGVGLSALNLFDKNYIGMITPNNYNVDAGTSYYAGAPRTVALTVNAKF